MMKATIVHGRFPFGGNGRMALNRREALVVSGVLVGVMGYLSALFLLV